MLVASTGLEMQSYPPGRPDHLPPGLAGGGRQTGHRPRRDARQSLDPFNTRAAICNMLYGGQVAVSETMGAAICSAVNDWLASNGWTAIPVCAPPSSSPRRPHCSPPRKSNAAPATGASSRC